MTVYILDNKKNYLNELTSWIMKKFINNLSNLDIIVSDVVVANALQTHIIKANKNNLFTLPRIFPIQSFFIVNSSIILNDHSSFISHQEITLVVSKNIRTLSKNKISLKAAIAMSQKIIELLYDFYKAEKDINTLDALFYDFAEHNNFLRDLLNKINTRYQIHLRSTKKIDYVFNLMKQIKKLINIIQKNSYKRNLITIGIVDEFAYPLFKTMIEKNHHVILPPCNQKLLSKGESITKLLNYCNLQISDLQQISNSKDYIISCNSNSFSKKIIYKEFETDIQEINYIIVNIQTHFQDQSNTEITIVTDNDKLIQIIENVFSEVNIINKVGNLIKYNKVTNLLLAIANLFEPPITIKNFLNLIKNPCINLDTYEFESYLYKKNLQNGTIKDILSNLSKKWPDIFNIYTKISTIDYLDIQQYKLFSDLLNINLKILEVIYPTIWSTQDGEIIMNYVKETYNSSLYQNKILIRDYPSIISMLFRGKYYKEYNNQYNQTINIISPHQIPYLCNSNQHIIVPDFYQDNWPLNVHQETFLTSNMRKNLSLEDTKNKINDLYQCYFDYLQQFNKITLSRAIKINKSYTRKSQYTIAIQQAKATLPSLEEAKQDQLSSTILNPNKEIFFTYAQEDFKKIAATQIDLLLKNPYEYYAKKILSLKYIDFFKTDPTAADFGIFIHKTIELFSKSSYKTKDFFLSIAKNLLNTTYHNKKTLWYTKIEGIAEDFIALDSTRNKQTNQILSEEYGQMTLKLPNKKSVIIFGIFDKIELCNNKITILDYKTGSIPTIKSIKEGKHLQLIIGLLIANYGKFNHLPHLTKIQNNNIAYIKLNNKLPYWQTLEIALTQDFLYKQYCNIKDMLNYFTTSNTKYHYLDYSYCDYKHLSRYQVNQ